MGDLIVIGLTGNIATGKSTVMELLAQRGAFAIDADKLVHQLLQTDPMVQNEIAARFGPGVQSRHKREQDTAPSTHLFRPLSEIRRQPDPREQSQFFVQHLQRRTIRPPGRPSACLPGSPSQRCLSA